MEKIVTRYDYAERAKRAPGISFPEPSLTNQSDMKDADINEIWKKVEAGAIIKPREPVYGDFSEVTDFHQMQIALTNAQRVFNQMPVAIRNRFNNNVQELIDFIENPANKKEAVKLGLINPRVLLTALDLDEKTPITPEDRAYYDAQTAQWKLARIESLKKLAENPPVGASGS